LQQAQVEAGLQQAAARELQRQREAHAAQVAQEAQRRSQSQQHRLAVHRQLQATLQQRESAAAAAAAERELAERQEKEQQRQELRRRKEEQLEQLRQQADSATRGPAQPVRRKRPLPVPSPSPPLLMLTAAAHQEGDELRVPPGGGGLGSVSKRQRPLDFPRQALADMAGLHDDEERLMHSPHSAQGMQAQRAMAVDDDVDSGEESSF